MYKVNVESPGIMIVFQGVQARSPVELEVDEDSLMAFEVYLENLGVKNYQVKKIKKKDSNVEGDLKKKSKRKSLKTVYSSTNKQIKLGLKT